MSESKLGIQSRIILASGSQSRAALLATISVPFDVMPADINERAVQKGSSETKSPDIAMRLAEAKARHVAALHPDRIVIGADQVLELDGDLLHKPADEAEAAAQITRMAGRTHTLHSAVAIVSPRSGLDSFVRSAFMSVRPLDAEAVRRYVALAAEKGMLSSVGGYHFEGAGITLFSSVSGSHSTILGLPLQEMLRRLQAIDLHESLLLMADLKEPNSIRDGTPTNAP